MGLSDPRSSAWRFPWAWTVVAGAAGLGIAAVVGAMDGPYLEPGRGGTTYAAWPAELALFLPYGLALVAAARGHAPTIRALLPVAVALHALLAVVPPPGSQDVFQYLFYGKMTAFLGANPYLVEPLRFATDPWFDHITWVDQTSVYGPLWTVLGAGAVRAAGRDLLPAFLAMKGLVLALDVATMAALVALGKARRDREDGPLPWSPSFGLLAWALNPMVLLTVPVEAHADVAVAVAFVAAVLARRRGRAGWATALLALGTLVRPYAGIALLLHLASVLRTRGRRAAAVHLGGSAAIAAALLAPFWGGLNTFSGAGEVARRFGVSLAGTLYRLVTDHPGGPIERLDAVGVAIIAVGALAMVGVSAAALRRVWQAPDDGPTFTEAVTLSFGVALLVSPWFFPWHLLPIVALACAMPSTPSGGAVLVATASTSVELRFGPRVLRLILQAAVRYGPPVATWVRLRRRARLRGPSEVSAR
jgi:Glycosyltransferase family 87